MPSDSATAFTQRCLPIILAGCLQATKAIASISIMKSGPARRRTSTVVLVGVAGLK